MQWNGLGLASQKTWLQILAPSLTSSVNLEQTPNLLGPMGSMAEVEQGWVGLGSMMERRLMVRSQFLLAHSL